MNAPLDTTEQLATTRFAQAASTYDRHAQIQAQVAETLLNEMTAPASDLTVLDIGCGTGQLTRRFLSRFPTVTLDALDEASTMLDVARSVVLGVRHWINASLPDWQPSTPYDLLISSATLQWLQPIPTACHQLHHLLKPDGGAFLAIMTRDTLHELHTARAQVAPHKPPRDRLAAPESYTQAFAMPPWRIVTQKQQRFVATYPDVVTLLRALHEQGVTGGSVSRSAQPLTRSELRQLSDVYPRTPNGDIEATYDVLFLHLIKETT